jgi:hypothetical protein
MSAYSKGAVQPQNTLDAGKSGKTGKPKTATSMKNFGGKAGSPGSKKVKPQRG